VQKKTPLLWPEGGGGVSHSPGEMTWCSGGGEDIKVDTWPKAFQKKKSVFNRRKHRVVKKGKSKQGNDEQTNGVAGRVQKKVPDPGREVPEKGGRTGKKIEDAINLGVGRPKRLGGGKEHIKETVQEGRGVLLEGVGAIVVDIEGSLRKKMMAGARKGFLKTSQHAASRFLSNPEKVEVGRTRPKNKERGRETIGRQKKKAPASFWGTH